MNPQQPPKARKVPRKAKVMFAHNTKEHFRPYDTETIDWNLPLAVIPCSSSKQAKALCKVANLSREERAGKVARIIKRDDSCNYDPDMGPGIEYYKNAARRIDALYFDKGRGE